MWGVTRLVVIGLVVSLGLFGCEDGAGLLGVQDASVDAGAARLMLPPETELASVDATYGRVFLEARGLGLLALHLATGELELITSNLALYQATLTRPLGEGVVFLEPNRVVVDPGQGRPRIEVEGEMFVLVGDVVLVAGPALHRVDPWTGEVRRLADAARVSYLQVVPGRAEVAKVFSPEGESWTYFAETDAIVPNGRALTTPLRRGLFVQDTSESGRLITAGGAKVLPFATTPGPDLLCGGRGTTAFLQLISGLPEWRAVEAGRTLGYAIPSAQGCAYRGENATFTWVGVDGATQSLFESPVSALAHDFGDGLFITLADPTWLITNERGLQQLSLPEGFEFPEHMSLALVRGDHLRLIGTKTVSVDPLVEVSVHADVDLTTGQVHPRDMQGLLLGQHQPGSGAWLGATDREVGPAAGPTIPYAVNVETGERRALSAAPVPLPAHIGGESLDSVITVGDRAVYFEQVFEGDEVVELRPVIVDL